MFISKLDIETHRLATARKAEVWKRLSGGAESLSKECGTRGGANGVALRVVPNVVPSVVPPNVSNEVSNGVPNISLRWPVLLKSAAAAAAVATIGIAAMHFVRGVSQQDATTVIAASDRERVTLPDGTLVTLSRGAELRYEVTSGARSAELKGVACFCVAKDSLRPFTVEAGAQKVTVLGTKFTLYNTANVNCVEVESGHVRYAAGNGSVELYAGDKAVTHPNGEPLKLRSGQAQDNTDGTTNQVSWADASMRLQNSTLTQTIEALRQLYPQITSVVETTPGVIKAADEIKVTTSFKDAAIEQVLAELAMHYGVKLRLKGAELQIEG